MILHRQIIEKYLEYYSNINVQMNNSKDNKKSQQYPFNLINGAKNRIRDSLIQTKSVPVFNKSIPPVINVLK